MRSEACGGMNGPLLQLLLVWLVGIPAAVLVLAATYPRYIRSRTARSRRRIERQTSSR